MVDLLGFSSPTYGSRTYEEQRIARKKVRDNREREIQICAPNEDHVIDKGRAFGVPQVCGSAGHVEVWPAGHVLRLQSPVVGVREFLAIGQAAVPVHRNQRTHEDGDRRHQELRLRWS